MSGESISNHYLLIFAVIALGLMATDVRACDVYHQFNDKGELQTFGSSYMTGWVAPKDYGTTRSVSCDNGMLWESVEKFHWVEAIAYSGLVKPSQVRDIQEDIDIKAEVNGNPIDWSNRITFYQNCKGVFQLIIIEGK